VRAVPRADARRAAPQVASGRDGSEGAGGLAGELTKLFESLHTHGVCHVTVNKWLQLQMSLRALGQLPGSADPMHPLLAHAASGATLLCLPAPPPPHVPAAPQPARRVPGSAAPSRPYPAA
jgi:hypothetical protein